MNMFFKKKKIMKGINFLEEREEALRNVLEGLGEPIFDKEVLGRSFYSDCVNFFSVCNK